MAMDLRISFEDGLLRATMTGEFSLDEAKRTYLEVLDAVTRHQADRVLMDGLELTGEPRVIERFYYGEFAAESLLRLYGCGVTCMPRFAYLLKVPVLDESRFGETVARNRGMLVRTFDTLESAMEWLG